MKIAIYGVSRSGKNYLIEKLIRRLNCRAIHLEGSQTLNDLARQMFDMTFKQLSEIDKETLRKKFTEIVKEKEREFGIVIVDGHYSFPNGDGYRVVYTDEDRRAYDAFFYLDTPSCMIVQFSRNSTGEKQNSSITEEQIRNWKGFEKSEMAYDCQKYGKELIILDEDTDSCIQFICEYVKNGSYLRSPLETARSLLSGIQISDTRVLLVDCDKTISENDVTYDFCRALEIESSHLKNIFRKDRYTAYQFFKLARLYGIHSDAELHEAAVFASKRLILNDSLVNGICKANGAYVIGITSGVYGIWDIARKARQLFHTLLGCARFDEGMLLVTPLVKKAVVRLLQEQGKTVVAVGDSLIDMPMLEEADHGYLVAHEKLNTAVVSYLKKRKTKIKQLKLSHHFYKNTLIESDLI